MGLGSDRDTRFTVKTILALVDMESESIIRNIWVKKPNMLVELEYEDDVGLGFSKVCYPDTWSFDRGLTIATAKAAQDLAAHLKYEL